MATDTGQVSSLEYNRDPESGALVNVDGNIFLRFSYYCEWFYQLELGVMLVIVQNKVTMML